jgi:hypothetical protein
MEGTLPPVPRRPSLALCCAALLAVAAAGCGADQEGPSQDEQVRAVVARYGVATRTRDYQTICDRLLARALVKRVEDLGLPCESALQRGLADVRDPRLQIRDVSIGSGRALVSVHSTAQGEAPADVAIQLVLENGEWRIASLAEPQASSASAPASTSAPASSAAPASVATPSSTATPTTTTSTVPAPGKRKKKEP